MSGDDDIMGMNTEQGLATEVIKLLGDELQRVRDDIAELHRSEASMSTPIPLSDAGIYMMQEENMRLQQELKELAQRCMQAKEVVAAVRVGPRSRQLPAAGVALAHNLDLAQDDNIARMQSKLSANKEKYKQAKSGNAALRETITGTEVLLEEVRSEQDSACKRLRMAEAELLKLKENARVFSPTNFLSRALPDESLDTATALEGLVFQCGGERLKLSQNAINSCVPGGFISKDHKEVVWANNMETHCVVLSPTHRYDPKAAAGGWESPSDMKRQPGEEMDMFFMNKRKKWGYLGTYRCVGQEILSCRDVEKFAKSQVDSAIDITAVRGLPVIIHNAVKQMYANNVLKIACIGWQRVGFNQVLARVLRPERPQMTDSGQSSESAPAKRHRRDDDNAGKSSKRHKAT
ncbi:hypothetical protein OH76DRAFT_1551489 [Lentinus brumalis]|uniref:Uncharacterized protein n=1 Tax=Lentinus brumalis TaxID=2498619 RepID=A0A371DTY5_9APHY|nr:hypothetical protein OH76DRAFT_1551489 [Polyporus brumalis]